MKGGGLHLLKTIFFCGHGEKGKEEGKPGRRGGVLRRTVRPAQDERKLVNLAVQHLHDAHTRGRGFLSEERSSGYYTHDKKRERERDEEKSSFPHARTLFCTTLDKWSPTDPRCLCMVGDTSTNNTVHTFLMAMAAADWVYPSSSPTPHPHSTARERMRERELRDDGGAEFHESFSETTATREDFL